MTGEDLSVLDREILGAVVELGSATSFAIERRAAPALAAAKASAEGEGALARTAADGGPGASDVMFAALERLLDRGLVECEILLSEMAVMTATPAGARLLGREAPGPAGSPEDRWTAALEAEMRLVAQRARAILCDSLTPHRESVSRFLGDGYFRTDPDTYVDPAAPVRRPGQGEKSWALAGVEQMHECKIREIFRERVRKVIANWFDEMTAEVASVVALPFTFAVYPSGRPVAVLYRTRETPSRTWNRQMKALARFEKVLVLPHQRLIDTYQELTDSEFEARLFDGSQGTFGRRMDMILPYNLSAILETRWT